MEPKLLVSRALPLVLAAGLAAPALAQQYSPIFSIDFHGPTIGMPDSGTGIPITEGDMLRPLPFTGPGPMPTPWTRYGAGPGPWLHHFNLARYPICVGHAPGVICGVEVDAFSLGVDPVIDNDAFLAPGRVFFSVDEFAMGVPVSPLLPELASETPVGDSSADIFTNITNVLLPNPPPPIVPGQHMAVIDGNGMPGPPGSRFSQVGLGLIEPNSPQGAPADPGDNLDALEMEPSDWSALFFSLDSLYVDPHPLMGGTFNSGSAFLHGFLGGDVLMAMPQGNGPMLYAPAQLLGLGHIGDPDSDDLDALVLNDNGNLTFEPPLFPGHWVQGQSDFILFSVRRGSSITTTPGVIDSLRGLPIEEGDILMPPVAPQFGGLSPYPAIYIPAEALGLATVRSATPSQVAPALGWADDLNALDLMLGAVFDLFAAEYGFCATGSPCGNVDPLAGCANATGAGGRLSASGSSRVSLDDLVLTTTQLPPNQFGLVFMGGAQQQNPAGNGQIVVGPGATALFRYPARFTGPQGVTTEGPGIVAYAAANFPSVGQITAGSTWNYQCWYRDPGGTCGATYNFSNGVAVLFAP